MKGSSTIWTKWHRIMLEADEYGYFTFERGMRMIEKIRMKLLEKQLEKNRRREVKSMLRMFDQVMDNPERRR